MSNSGSELAIAFTVGPLIPSLRLRVRYEDATSKDELAFQIK